jgi:NitT/TauT family transport system substrate-binding protein
MPLDPRKLIRMTTCAAVTCVGLAIQLVVVAAADAIPAKPEAGTFKLGIEPWLGYGPWHVAAKKGFFTKRGLSNVDIVNFTEDRDLNAALASGQLDAVNIATHTAMGMVTAGLPVKIVMLLDFSLTADAIIAGTDVKSVADLKGKEVAFEQGTTSEILLNYALSSNGMAMTDVKPIPMSAADAGGALIAGRVPAAVTYEPYISAARKQDPTLQLLFTAGNAPGLVSDILVVREDVIKSKPGQVLALMKAWGDALEDYRANTAADRKIIAEAVGSPPEDLATAFDGVRYYSPEENKMVLGGDFRTKTFSDVLKAAKQAKLVTKDVSAEEIIDGDFIAAIK